MDLENLDGFDLVEFVVELEFASEDKIIQYARNMQVYTSL
jgi:hypothetical protein